MKRVFLSLIFSFVFLGGAAFAQLKIGYVDSRSIMDNLPDAQDARQKLDAMISDWQAELNRLESDWKTKYDDYEKRKLIMTDQTRADVENDLVRLEKSISEYREKKFGTNGELFQKQEELMKPIQNRVFEVIKEVAEEEEYDYVFDRSGDIVFLYTKDKYDITPLVLNKLKLK